MNLRCLIVLTAAPHNNVSGTGLGPQVLLVDIVAGGRLFEEGHGSGCHSADVSTRVRRDNAKQALASFFRKIGLLEDTFGGVDVREVKRGSRVARIEDSSETHTGLQRADPVDVKSVKCEGFVVLRAENVHDVVHFVVHDVTSLSEIHRIDHFIVAVIFIAVEILGLPTMPRIMKDEGVVGSGVLDQPVHRSNHVRFRRLAHGVLLIVGEADHILSLVSVGVLEVG